MIFYSSAKRDCQQHVMDHRKKRFFTCNKFFKNIKDFYFYLKDPKGKTSKYVSDSVLGVRNLQ